MGKTWRKENNWEDKAAKKYVKGQKNFWQERELDDGYDYYEERYDDYNESYSPHTQVSKYKKE